MYSWLGEKENEKKKEEGGGTSVSLVQLKPLLGLYSVCVRDLQSSLKTSFESGHSMPSLVIQLKVTDLDL